MSLYYVTAVLVVDGEDEGQAESRAEDNLSALLSLKPKDIDGYTLPNGTTTTPASENWADKGQVLNVTMSRGVFISEEEL